jgi:hypothetical protein
MPIKSIEVPSQSRLRELFDYADGQLIWKARPLSEFKNQRACNIWNTRYAGKVAGGLKPDGYWAICIDYVRYKAHRLVYAWHNGAYPSQLEIDHINGVPSDNRIENLRLATRTENVANSTKPYTNTSGFKGVFWSKRGKKFTAQIRINGKRTHLGYFQSAEEAASVYARASLIHRGAFMHASLEVV